MLAAAASCIPTALLADVEPLTLYQKTARAPLVVKARALSDSTRRPQMEVLEIFKGSYPAKTLTIAPHFEDNTRPMPWLKREVFRRGEESILFLSPYLDEFGRDEGPDTFELLNADQGKVGIPAEGGDALVEALRRFVSIQSWGQHDKQGEALRGMLRQQNPHLLEAGLTECRKFHLAEPEDAETLVGLIAHPRPEFRATALELLGQIVKRAQEKGSPAPAPTLAGGSVFERIAAAGRLDAHPMVRRQAIGALEAFADTPALLVIEAIGRSDASQDVRYEAQVAAYRLRERTR